MADTAITVIAELPIGIELDADLSRPLIEEDQRTLRQLYLDHHLVLFRNQGELSSDDHKRLGSYLGPVPVDREGDLAVHQIAKDGALGAAELVFHSDLSFDPKPYEAVSLLAKDIDPPEETSTTFADAVAAYARLTVEQQERIAGRTTRHLFPIDTGARSVDEDRPQGFPEAEHPIVMEHPGSGVPLLYVTFQASTGVSGLPADEGEALLQELFDVLYDPAHLYDHRWRTGDLIVWDNRSVQHARGDQGRMRARTLQRLVLTEKTVDERYHEFFEQSAELLARVSRR
jgi:taurine dioxygenase